MLLLYKLKFSRRFIFADFCVHKLITSKGVEIETYLLSRMPTTAKFKTVKIYVREMLAYTVLLYQEKEKCTFMIYYYYYYLRKKNDINGALEECSFSKGAIWFHTCSNNPTKIGIILRTPNLSFDLKMLLFSMEFVWNVTALESGLKSIIFLYVNALMTYFPFDLQGFKKN